MGWRGSEGFRIFGVFATPVRLAVLVVDVVYGRIPMVGVVMAEPVAWVQSVILMLLLSLSTFIQ